MQVRSLEVVLQGAIHTPYHLGPARSIAMLLSPHVDIAAVMLASVVVDVEPLRTIMSGFSAPLHGPLHTYLGATLMTLVCTLRIIASGPVPTPLMELFSMRQCTSRRRTFVLSLLGSYSHVFLDSFPYPDTMPFYTRLSDPMLGPLTVPVV